MSLRWNFMLLLSRKNLVPVVAAAAPVEQRYPHQDRLRVALPI
jgi:hypothetical protein